MQATESIHSNCYAKGHCYVSWKSAPVIFILAKLHFQTFSHLVYCHQNRGAARSPQNGHRALCASASTAQHLPLAAADRTARQARTPVLPPEIRRYTSTASGPENIQLLSWGSLWSTGEKSICKAQQQRWSPGDEPDLAGRDDLIREFPPLISSTQGNPESTTRPLALLPNRCIIQRLAQDPYFQRFLIWRKSLKIPPRMPEVNSLFKASAAQANWHRAAAEIPGPCHTAAAVPQKISIASYHWGRYLQINHLLALPTAERWVWGFVRTIFSTGANLGSFKKTWYFISFAPEGQGRGEYIAGFDILHFHLLLTPTWKARAPTNRNSGFCIMKWLGG